MVRRKGSVSTRARSGPSVYPLEAFDERDPGMLKMLRLAVTGAKRNHRHVGICGEAPANYPEIAQFLAGLGIDSISVTGASLLRTITVVHQAEQSAAARPVAAQ